ncbi:hypothetical protein FORC22_1321 [Vibrio parahaemolyticus]|nr:hypothetical protein FORC22_1321 [Vibrio parahaemolyticus]
MYRSQPNDCSFVISPRNKTAFMRVDTAWDEKNFNIRTLYFGHKKTATMGGYKII